MSNVKDLYRQILRGLAAGEERNFAKAFVKPQLRVMQPDLLPSRVYTTRSPKFQRNYGGLYKPENDSVILGVPHMMQDQPTLPAHEFTHSWQKKTGALGPAGKGQKNYENELDAWILEDLISRRVFGDPMGVIEDQPDQIRIELLRKLLKP